MSDYDPGAGLSEASAFEERMNAGWYDDPPDWDDVGPSHRRSRCLVCDTLDYHERFVTIETTHGRFVGNFPVCGTCKVGKHVTEHTWTRKGATTYKAARKRRAAS